ncbi:urease accessory protein UreF [Dactylosporangium sp. CA-139066]|uniref:urease accessory protein UreF n=1 Tax=Dactylosporangium sp. CA-139066 TaxID=3239930 RepID=UPI003D94DDF9
MSDVAQLVRAVHLGDSALPVGAFAFSNALEAAVEEGAVADPESLAAFVAAVTGEAASADGVALLAAHRAAAAGDEDGARRADAALLARKTDEELRTQCVRMGHKLAEVATSITDSPAVARWRSAVDAGQTPGTYPAGLGVVCAALGVGEEAAFAVHQHGLAVMITGAALRLMRIDHRQTQRILGALADGVAADYASAADTDLSDMSAFTPQLGVLSAAHTRAHVRLFMS